MVIHDSWEACGSLFAALKYSPKLLASVVKAGHCTGYCMYFNSEKMTHATPHYTKCKLHIMKWSSCE